MNLKDHKKAILQGVFLVVVLLLTWYGVLHGQDMEKLKGFIVKSNPIYLSIAGVLVVAFIYTESVIIHYLMNSVKVGIRRWTCFLLSSVGFFFSSITPSASGGQPMQIYYLKKMKVPIPVSMLILMVVTITYKLVLVLVGIGITLFGQSLIHTYMQGVAWVFYLGIVLNTALVIAMLMLVFYPQTAKKLTHKTFAILGKIKIIKHTPKRIEKIEESMDLYGEVASYFKNNVSIIFRVLALTFVQRFALFTTTYFVYRAMGLSGESAVLITMLQAAIAVAVDMMPLPGGMGASEKLFSIIFLPIFGPNMILPGLVLSRGIAYYIQLILSAVMTAIAQLSIGRKKNKCKIDL